MPQLPTHTATHYVHPLTDPAALAARIDGVDPELLFRYLRAMRGVADGNSAAGPVALVPPSERFRWLTAPRSDVLHSSPVHEGVCGNPGEALTELFAEYVGVTRESATVGTVDPLLCPSEETPSEASSGRTAPSRNRALPCIFMEP